MKKIAKAGLLAIKEELGASTFSVSITSDIWSGRAKQDYISVVAHYVSKNWELQKRVIGFELIDVAHTGENIAQAIVKVVDQFGLSEKIFAVTLDNASSNSSAMNILTPLFEVYASSFLLHQRCACHIINLIAKTALKNLEPHIDQLRLAIGWLNGSNPRLANYARYCALINVPCHKFSQDMPVRWNSTYLMLNSLIADKVPFSAFINQHCPYKGPHGEGLLTEATWHIAESMVKFLETFYESTVSLSGVYYPTSPMIVHNILEIAQHLKDYENDPILLEAVGKMKLKYLKYWKNIPFLYAFAFILDPRAKMSTLVTVLSHLSYTVNVSYDEYFAEVKDKLAEVYGKYEVKYGSLPQYQRPPLAPTAGKKKKVWGRLFGTSSSASASSSSTQTHASPTFSGGGELAKYLNSDLVPHDDDDEFDILRWWHDKKTTYPVLSILARDVISVPVSTVSSESAFSMCGRIIDDRRQSLTPDMVKCLMTVKDGELAKRRAQHSADNAELVSAFEAMTWNEESEN